LPEPTGANSSSLNENNPSITDQSSAGVVSTDPAKWVIDDSTTDFLFSREISQNLDEDFSKTKTFDPAIKKHRSLTKNMFQWKMHNGKKINRKYLCYSPSRKALFCIPCRLFGDSTSKLGTEGLSDWKNAVHLLNSHGNSREHLESHKWFLAWSKITGRVDEKLCAQIEAEFTY